MATIRENGHEYSVRDTGCIRRSCLKLGQDFPMIFMATGMMISRKGDYCCLTRATKGCPNVLPEHDLDLGSRAETKTP